MKPHWLVLLACLSLSAAESQKSTRALHNVDGVGVAGYIHRPANSAKVRIVLQPTVRKQSAAIDWSMDGVGWDVDVHPGIGIRHICELIPLSVHDYRHKAAMAEPKWPTFDLLAPTSVLRRTGDRWEVVADSGRRFVWKEGFVLQDGDVIAVREVDPY
jgi:hypothetical protein